LIDNTKKMIKAPWVTKWQQRAASRELPTLVSKKSSWRLEYHDNVALIDTYEKQWKAAATPYIKHLEAQKKLVDVVYARQEEEAKAKEAAEQAQRRIKEKKQRERREKEQEEVSTQPRSARKPATTTPSTPHSVHSKENKTRIAKLKKDAEKKREQEAKKKQEELEASRLHREKANEAMRTSRTAPKTGTTDGTTPRPQSKSGKKPVVFLCVAVAPPLRNQSGTMTQQLVDQHLMKLLSLLLEQLEREGLGRTHRRPKQRLKHHHCSQPPKQQPRPTIPRLS
jgi:hypothetical protein